MAGYVIWKLSRNFHSMDLLVESDKENITELYSMEWINLIDCGGLVHITEECYQVFLSIEYVTRHHMCMNNSKSMDDGFQKHLVNMR